MADYASTRTLFQCKWTDEASAGPNASVHMVLRFALECVEKSAAIKKITNNFGTRRLLHHSMKYCSY